MCLLYKIYYTSSNSFNVKGDNTQFCNSNSSLRKKENLPDSNLMFRLLLLHIHPSGSLQNRILTQIHIQIAPAPRHMVSILPPFPSIPRKPHANGHPCPWLQL